MEIKNIVNLKDYPIDQTGSKEYQDLITKNRKLLDKDGCCVCLLYTSPSPRDRTRSRMPSSA